jgi:hypothetical protein
MKTLTVLITLFLSLSAAAEEIKVPNFMVGVKEDKSASKPPYYVYQVEGMFSIKDVEAKMTKNSSIEELVSTLIYAYQKNDKQLFYSLFTSAALAEIKQMPAEIFDKTWKFYSTKKNIKLHFYHTHRNGFLLGLKAPGDKNFNVQFVIRSAGKFYFERFKVDEFDLRYHNLGMYMTYSPIKVSSASLVESFKAADKERWLQAQISVPYLAVLRKNKDGWFLIGQTKDNDQEYSTWPDTDKAEGIIRINAEGIGVDPKEPTEILVLESSFPITGYPLSLAAKGQIVLQ